jgi:hypothetical protein
MVAISQFVGALSRSFAAAPQLAAALGAGARHLSTSASDLKSVLASKIPAEQVRRLRLLGLLVVARQTRHLAWQPTVCWVP